MKKERDYRPNADFDTRGTPLPRFYCMKALLGFHPGPDLNRITLYGPNDFQFVLYEMGEPRDAKANQRCNELAAALSKIEQG